MCGCFGVDEEDILLLLDYGYRPDEIEDMLMDSDLISETIGGIRSLELCEA